MKNPIEHDQIVVKSHVARDLLQSAALFKTDKLVVWEYVANSLQYVDHGTNPVVKVKLESKTKRIIITDNGRGMDWADLQNFFIMHGENLDRQSGRPGRGRFGTGKSAVFGIADVLRVTTVKNHKRSCVELSRAEIETMGSEDQIPVKSIEREYAVSDANGTIVEIEGIHLRSIDQAGVIRYIERHLARWPRNVLVFVNNHECEVIEPPVSHKCEFEPEGVLADTIGDTKLIIKVSKMPLDEELRGVSIYSKGIWYETTLAGSEGREMAQYIFGEIEVSALDEDTSPVAPINIARSMQLNANNPLVQAIYSFIGQKVELVRRDLVETEKVRKASEEMKKLDKQANEIASMINEDFDGFRRRLARAKAQAGVGSDLGNSLEDGGTSDDELLFGTEVPANIISDTGGPGTEGSDSIEHGIEPRNLLPQVMPADTDAENRGRLAGGNTGTKKRPRGGFQVRFENMGEESHRAKYVRDERTIFVNLDHPQLYAAIGLGSVEDPVFRRLAYEIAFAEYAIALASELAAHDEYIDPSDPIVDIRETLNRIARKSASLYT